VFFMADLVGAWCAIGALFPPSLPGFALIAVVAALEITLIALVGLALGWIIPQRLWPRLRHRGSALALFLFAVSVAVGGYLARHDRTPPPLPPPPPLTLASPTDTLIVLIDTLRADTTYGPARDFPLAPALRRFAEHALIFDDAESAAGWTIPSVATLLTGLHPETLYSARRFLPEWAPTLAERLRAAGYRTEAVVDNALLERRNGFAQGFDTWHQRSAYRFAFSLPGFRLLPMVAREWLREVLPTTSEGAPGVTDAALTIINTPHERPLFLYVHYMDVHQPFAHTDTEGPEANTVPYASWVAASLRANPGTTPSAEANALFRHRYEGELHTLDNQLGRLLEAWAVRFGSRGIALVTADHGEEFMEHGGFGHGQSLYRELVHVPLLLQLPDRIRTAIAPGTHLTAPVGLVDITPTLLEATGVGLEPGADGVRIQGLSLLPWLRGETAAPTRGVFASQSHFGKRIYRYREGDWVHITTFPRKSEPFDALFDLSADPGELHDHRVQRADVVSDLMTRSEPLMRLQEAERDPRPVTNGESLDGLKALGYVQ